MKAKKDSRIQAKIENVARRQRKGISSFTNVTEIRSRGAKTERIARNTTKIEITTQSGKWNL